MNFVTWSIRNPVPVIVLFMGLLIAGIFSFPRLGIQDQPDIEFPAVVVTVTYAGVAPTQMESEITRKVEDAVSTISGIEQMTSTVDEGVSTTVIEFHFGTDLSQAVDDVRDAMTQIRSNLPLDANEPIVSRVTTAGSALVTWTVSSDSMSDTELSWFVDLNVARELSSVPGIGKVTRVGGVDREIRVDLDPDRMAALGANASDVSQQLSRIQAEFPGGQARIGGLEQTVRTTGTVDSVQELKQLPIVLSDGRSVRLDTIADVRDQAAEQRSIALLNGKPVVGFQIVRSWGASALDVANDARAKVQDLATQYPNIHFQEASSTVGYIQTSFDSSMEMLIEGAILAVIVVWLFLRDWRATVISAVALPLSIVPTFWAIYMLGFTLNILTMLALTLVVGILVDDAIVEVENIVRHLRQGKPPKQAAMDAAIEIGLAVVATSLTICAVFIPVAFMSGIAGQFFAPFGFTVTVAVLFSLLVARTLTPMMAAYFLKPHDRPAKQPKALGWYLERVRWCLHHRWITLGVASAVLFAMLGLFPLLPQGFSPAGDNGFTTLSVELPPGSRLDDTLGVVREIRSRLLNLPETGSIFTTIGTQGGGGFGGGGGAGDVRSGKMTIQINNVKGIRGAQQAYEGEATALLRDIPGARLQFQGGGGDSVQITLAGDNGPLLSRTAQQLEQQMRSLQGIDNITSNAALQTPEIVVRPWPDRAAELGVTTQTLALVTRIATSGDIENGLAKFNLDNRQIPIRVRLNDATRSNLDRLRMLPVPARGGATVPLMNVADVTLGSGPAQINRIDRSRDITITARLDGLALGDALKAAENLPAMQSLPEGVRELRTGDARWIMEIFTQFGIAMGVGVLSIYAVLVILFHKFIQPVTILSALPPSVAGAFVALVLTGNGLAINSLIGLLMLMGIVSKNSILLVEYAIKAQREHGLSRFDALIDSCSKRARPIVMTTIAMGAGMMPVALGLAGDPSFRAPMGIAVVGGIIVSTVMSLFIVPAMFTVIDDFQQWLGGLFGRRGEGEYPEGMKGESAKTEAPVPASVEA
ncbi:MAG TPA: efflux RND transporter permease subunit [Gammaproteobacteria bacterium]|nr:efflux RND transporter permease subunit [Gammaproteobacteria bacterium]